MTQVTHLGQRTSNYAHEWLPAVAASAVREPAHRAFTKAAEPWDMDRILDGFVSVAQRCEAAGLDGIELMTYGHFLDSFWTPFWNHRDDQFGGTYDNRVRYPLQVIRAVRAAVGDDFIVGARMSFDEDRAGGVGAEESLRIAGDITAAGVDFISVVKGSIETDGALAKMIPPMGTPSSPHLDFAGRVRKQLTVPVMHAAGIADVATARHAVAEGLLDLVGMTRALMADPDLPLKASSGRSDQIRPCVGANMCIDGIYSSGAALCIHNPSTGRELELPHRVEPSPAVRRVAVIGAGPAGLEAARVLGERGHDTTVFEAGARPGGQLVLASLSDRRRDLQGIIDWRVQELDRLGVTIELDAYVTSEQVLATEWDVVIVATGGIPAAPTVPGGSLALDTWDVISGSSRPTGDVLVYDDHGSNQALDAVERLVAGGARPRLVTPERTVSPDVGSLTAAGYFAHLAQNGVPITILRRLLAIDRVADQYTVTLGVDGSAHQEQLTVDAVVAEMGTTAVHDLYDELVPVSTNLGSVDLDNLLALRPQQVVLNADGAFQLFRIGDAVASRNVHAAMLDAARCCRAI